MNRKLLAVTLASVMVLSVVGVAGAGALGAVDAQAGNDAATSATVSASGSGEVSAEPDQAVVHVAVVATGENASEATDRLADNVSTLRDALEDDNLSVVNVETTSYHVAQREGPPDRAGGPGQGQGQGDGDADDEDDDDDDEEREYVARQTFAVTTDDVDAAGQVIDAAVDGGADEIHSVQFTLSDERRDELRSEAIEDAVDDARSQAEAAASATGLTLGSVDSVSVDDDRNRFPFQTVEADVTAGTTVDPSPVTVSASVDITYNATSD